MFVLQNINEFIKLAKSSSNQLNHSSSVIISNKLRKIQHGWNTVTSKDLHDDFFTNLYALLCQSSCVKEDLLSSILDILISVISSEDSQIKERFVTDFRFLPVLITNILR